MSKPIILLVDDEEEIIYTLKLLFRHEGYEILSAANGAEALALLEKQPAWVALVDQRMPGMAGTELLRQIRARWPETLRVLNTGFTDINAAISAINEGDVYRYVSKPWDDQDLRSLVRGAVERYELLQENQRLQKLTEAQNIELTDLNRDLEARVQARTKEVEAKNEQLQDNFVKTVELLNAFIELQGADAKGHGQRVARAARFIAEEMGLDAQTVRHIEIAGMLHDLGKMGLPERLLDNQPARLTRDEFSLYSKYPVLGFVTLRPIQELAEVAVLVRHHREQLNGTGFPDRLHGDQIPLGARIILVADEFDENKNRQYLERQSGILFDAAVVAKLLRYIEQAGTDQLGPIERPIRVRQLRDGMVLSRDLYTRRGLLLATRGRIIDRSVADKIEHFHKVEPITEPIFVREWEKV